MSKYYRGPLIVGFGHRRRVGKDTLAGMVFRHLQMDAGLYVERVSFARRLKATAHRLFRYAGLEDPDFYDVHPERREEALPAVGMSPRDLWIALGVKLREVVPDIWIRNALDDHPQSNADVLLITDLRFPNEVAAIRERGGVVVKVLRPGTPKSSDPADSALAGMKTLEWNNVVINDGDLEKLDAKAKTLARWIAGRRTGGGHGTARLPA